MRIMRLPTKYRSGNALATRGHCENHCIFFFNQNNPLSPIRGNPTKVKTLQYNNNIIHSMQHTPHYTYYHCCRLKSDRVCI